MRLHLRSDVPVGSALSGGIDSSSIVAGIRAVGGSSIDLQAVSFVADEPRINEERWIDLSAREAKARVHKVEIESNDLMHDLEHLIRTQDEPFVSTSIYAQHRVFRMAADKRLKVMLDGQGADEIFAGYLSYLPYHWVGQIRAGTFWRAMRSARTILRTAAPSTGVSMSALVRRGASMVVPASLMPSIRSIGGQQEAPLWMNETWFSRRGVEFRPNPARLGLRRNLQEVLRNALLNTSLPALLRYEDPKLHDALHRESRAVSDTAVGGIRAATTRRISHRR